MCCFVFLESFELRIPAAFDYSIVQLSSICILGHEVEVFFGFEYIEQLDAVRMSDLLEDLDFPGHPLDVFRRL